MDFPFLEPHGWGKRSAAQPRTNCSEFPYNHVGAVPRQPQYSFDVDEHVDGCVIGGADLFIFDSKKVHSLFLALPIDEC